MVVQKKASEVLSKLVKDVRALTGRVERLENRAPAPAPENTGETVTVSRREFEELQAVTEFLRGSVFTLGLPVVAVYKDRYDQAVLAGDREMADDAEQTLDGILQLQARLDPENFRLAYGADPETGEALPDNGSE